MADGTSYGTTSILLATAKTVAVVGGLSLMAAKWVAGGFDQAQLARLSDKAVTDPVTTGSLGAAAAGARLDPCTMPRRS